MTSPGGEHISRYRAVAEFDNLIREAGKAKRALRELREEEAKLNAQSIADDKKVAASKQERTKAEKESFDSAKKSASDLNKDNSAGKAGSAAGVSYSREMGKGIEKQSQSPENKRFLDAATKALKGAFEKAGNETGTSYSKEFNKGLNKEVNATSSETIIENSVKKLRTAFEKAGDKSGQDFLVSVRQRFRKDSEGVFQNSGFEYSLREQVNRFTRAGEESGIRYTLGIATKLKALNENLNLLGQDELNLDVDTKDAVQSMQAIEIELKRISNITADPRVRIDSTRALADLRFIQKLFKDEVAEEIIKDSERIRVELEKLDNLPSGKAFKFWTLTALSDMTRVFAEAEKGTTVFDRLRRSIAEAGTGGGGNYFRTLISGFDDFSETSSKLLQRLSRVSGELYRMPGLIATAVAAIPALIAGVGAAGGAALGLSSALGALSGFAAAGPGILTAFITSISALKSTFGGLKETLGAARNAQAEEAEEREKARLGVEKSLTPLQKYNLLLDQMGDATGEFTQFWVTFGESYANVQKIVQENFFKEIVDTTEELPKILPIVENLLGKSATAIGKLADEGIRMITSGPWDRDFKLIAESNAVNITNMGKAGLALANAFRNITVAAGPFTEWVTGSIRDGAMAFADWSAQARSNGAITAFLGEARESGELLWQVFKNLGSTINSFFKSTVDEGQNYLRTLGDITGGWADVAKAQEMANSPLRQWMTNIRPVLSSLGDLVRDLSKGIGDLASNQSNITEIINLLDTLRTRVLPPILQILQELNDSGIAVTVTEAVGELLEAFATFLESGASNALSAFVTILAGFFEVLFEFVSLPGVSDIFGALASGIAAVAAVSIVARFSGLFKLWDFFTWMTRNKGNLSGAFADAARGVAGLPTNQQQALPSYIPSTVGNLRDTTPVTPNNTEGAAKNIERTGTAAQNSTAKINVFSRAVEGMSVAGNLTKGALGGLVGFLGGPWGLALIGATAGIGLLVNSLVNQKQEANETKDAFMALKNAYGDLSQGNTTNVESLAATDEKFKDITTKAKEYGLTLGDVSGALNANDQQINRVNSQLDVQIATYERLRIAAFDAGGPTAAIPFKEKRDQAIEYKNAINEVANAQSESNKVTDNSIGISRTYQDRLAGMTQAQVDNAVAAGQVDSQMRTLSNALDTLSSATATAEDRSRALSDIINHETGEMERANEASENWASRLLDLKEAIDNNGRSLDVNSRAGLRNRDALEAAAKASRALYLEDIAAGVPMDQATERHKKRIRALEEEAGKNKATKEEAKRLIDVYGKIPDDVKTDFSTSGYNKVYEELQKLKFLQTALEKGIPVDQAQGIVNKDLAEARRGSGGRGDGYGVQKFSTGGPVWGSGTRTSDSIRAWLSNGEFVQPTDAVEHYGMPVMEALRTKRLNKDLISEALPSSSNASFSSGGPAHSENCVSCASGGHKFARGGSVTAPFPVDVTETKIDKNWANAFAGGLGQETGTGGVAWMMRALRAQFPGLRLISGFRPNSTTLGGNRSYHSLNRAVDLDPRRDVAAWIRSNYGSRTKELITPYNDLNLWNGRPHRYTGAVWNQHNFPGGNAHNHWAFNKGGPVDVMKMLGMDNLMPQQNAPLPTTPRSLSTAASGVVNNSTDNTRTFGDVIINNPMPERAGDSIRDSLYRTQLMFG